MKKIVIMCLPILTFAGLNMDEVNSVLLSIHSSKELKYYSVKKDTKIDKKIKFTSCEDADIVLFSKKKCNKSILIADNYKVLKTNKNSIGAIFLKKERTEIVFIKERLKNKGIRLAKKFNNYIVDECRLSASCKK